MTQTAMPDDPAEAEVPFCPKCFDDVPPETLRCGNCEARRRRERNLAAQHRRRAKAAAAAAAGPLKERVAQTPTKRIASLLGILRMARNRTVPTDEIRRRVPGYDDTPAGRLLLSRDVGLLVARGMVQAAVTDDQADNRDGLRLTQPDKPKMYELTAEEHAALVAARRALRTGPLPGPLPGGRRRDRNKVADDVDLLMRLVRAVEEHADEIAVDRLAELVGASRERTVRVLREADDLRAADAFGGGGDLFPGLTIHYDDGDVDDAASNRGDDINAVSIVRRPRTADRRSPTRGLGLDELGRFAYTRAECDDRLELIGEAFEHDWVGTQEPWIGNALSSARRKIGMWQRMLPD